MKHALKNKQLKLEITEWSDKGLGIGYFENFPIHVANAVPGDYIESLVVKADKTMAFGKLLKLLVPSPNRSIPVCGVYWQCGGCQLQHVTYETQLQFKTERLQRAFSSQALQTEFLPILGMEKPFSYRNKAQYSMVREPNGSLSIGLSASRSSRVVDQRRCDIQPVLSHRAVAAVRDWVHTQDIPIWEPHLPGLSHVVTRVGFGSNEFMLGLSGNLPTLPCPDELIAALTGRIPELVSICYSVNPNPAWETLGPDFEVIWGQSFLTETVVDLDFEISLPAFFQGNTIQTAKLWQCLSDFLKIKKTDRVCDLYAGTGAISIYLAQFSAEVIGIESHPEAVKNARKNQVRNGVSNVRFIESDAEIGLNEIEENLDIVVLDPPRKGCAPSLLQALLNKKPEKIAYVSCAPDTLARDLLVLTQGGYRIDIVQPIDLFPQTVHLETIVVLGQSENTKSA